MEHNLNGLFELNQPTELSPSNQIASSFVPDLFPDFNFNQHTDITPNLNDSLSYLPVEMRQRLHFTNAAVVSSIVSSPQLHLQVSNSFSNIPTSYPPSVAVRPQQPPPISNYPLRNPQSIIPAELALFKTNSSFQPNLNTTINQMCSLQTGLNQISNFQNQLCINPLYSQSRPISGRPILGHNMLYSLSAENCPPSYHPSLIPQYNPQAYNTSQVRAQASVKNSNFLPNLGNSNFNSGTTTVRPVSKEESFAVLYSQLSVTNQMLLRNCLTKLKNKTMTWHEFQALTLNMFGEKHSTFIRAIGVNNYHPKLSQQKTIVNVQKHPRPSADLSSVSMNPLQIQPGYTPSRTIWNKPSNSRQVPYENEITNQLITNGLSQYQSLRLQAPGSNASSRSLTTYETRASGEENRNPDYDYTDVMGSVGVDLREESENIIRSFQGHSNFESTHLVTGINLYNPEEYRAPLLINIPNLKCILFSKAKEYNIATISSEFCTYLILAVEKRLKELIEQMICASKHRVLSHQTYPTPPLNKTSNPIYKVVVHANVKKQLKAIERVDKILARKYYLRLEENQYLNEGELRVKKMKVKQDNITNNNASANSRNISEESRKHLANQTTRMFTGGYRKSWMLTSTTPRISSPLASITPAISWDGSDDGELFTKKGQQPGSQDLALMQHLPNASSNLVPNPKGISTISLPILESDHDISRPAYLLPNQKPAISSHSNLNPPLNSNLFSKYANQSPTSRLITAEDALFVLESDTMGRPSSSRSQLLLQAYTNRS